MAEATREQREINGRLFDQAFSPDPAIACQAIGKLVLNLKITMKTAEDPTWPTILDRESIGANRAWFEYTEEKNPGRAMQTVRAVLTNIGELAYDKRFTTLQPDAFVGGVKS